MRPVSITADQKSKQLTIVWDDGHYSAYTFELLRLGCPCAECRGGHDKMSSMPDPQVFTQQMGDSALTALADIASVGNYAIRPIWEDGHDAGIYAWGYLRGLCPCPICRN